MVLLTYCIACQHGQHKDCQGGHAAPEGMLGGWRCRCEGECVERFRPFMSDPMARALTRTEPES